MMGKTRARLQLNVTSLSWPQSPQRRRRRRKPWARMPHSKNASNLSLMNCSRSAPAASSAWRRRSWRAGEPGGTAWSARGRGARSGQGCHPTPAGAAGQWLAHGAPAVMSPHALKPCAAPQSPCVPPADVAPAAVGLPTGACVRVRPAASGQRDRGSVGLFRVDSAPRVASRQQPFSPAGDQFFS